MSLSSFFFFTQLNGFTYLYQIQIILFTFNHLFAHSLMFSSILLTIQLNISHLFMQVNDQTVLFQTIQFSISTVFWFGLLWFYSISTIVGYLMPNPFYTYISNIYDLVGLGFMAYQPL